MVLPLLQNGFNWARAPVLTSSLHSPLEGRSACNRFLQPQQDEWTTRLSPPTTPGPATMGAAAADLEARQLRILGRIADLELAVQQHRLGALSVSAAPSENGEADAGATEARLSALLATRGVRDFAFRRVPADYYDRSLEERRSLLRADSVAQLCKSIVMVWLRPLSVSLRLFRRALDLPNC